MSLLIQQCGCENGIANAVRIHVGAGAAILQVALLGCRDTSRDANAAAAVGNSPTEFVDRRGFEAPNQATFVVFSPARIVGFDVLRVLLGELLDGLLNG